MLNQFYKEWLLRNKIVFRQKLITPKHKREILKRIYTKRTVCDSKTSSVHSFTNVCSSFMISSAKFAGWLCKLVEERRGKVVGKHTRRSLRTTPCLLDFGEWKSDWWSV